MLTIINQMNIKCCSALTCFSYCVAENPLNSSPNLEIIHANEITLLSSKPIDETGHFHCYTRDTIFRPDYHMVVRF